MTDADVEQHGEDYRRLLSALRDGAIDLAAARRAPRRNADLTALIHSEARS